ncbi:MULTISPECIES: hypothetical protein [unclassified Mesorhizobium]|uniref:hypothetical protein n=1 Tax=unclassified Mesorhizobium TaxID=325217 RepID=UPI0032B140A4
MSSATATSITTEKKGYGRGLILGLTMAETMLLLVFCLLLAAGAIIAKERKVAVETQKVAEEAKAKAERENENLRKTISSVKAGTGHWVSEDEWKELVPAQKAADAIEAAGLTLDEAVELAPSTKVLRDNDITEEIIREWVPALKTLSAKGLSARDVVANVEKSETSKPHEWPPIINLNELEGYNFDPGSAELSDQFRTKLRQKSAEIAATAKKYQVDIIEVIGHTDEQTMSGDSSNMDRGLRPVLERKEPIGYLHPADNAGLGLARAISVAKFLEAIPQLEGFTILPMSGGQLILPGDKLTDGNQLGDVKARRRIEIRVRKSNPVAIGVE